MLNIFLIIFLVQIVFFLLASWKKTDKFTDISYGLTFVGVTIYLYLTGEMNLFRLVLTGIISLWGIRLALYLFVRILKTKTDKRFDGIRENIAKFAGFWTLQAVTITVVLLPVIYVLINSAEMKLNWISIIGSVVALKGLFLETIADAQKFKFKSEPKNEGLWIESGLWRLSRHPNYLGEITFWLGVFIYCAPYLTGSSFFLVISPFYIIFLLLFVSGVPTLEKKYNEKYSGNKSYSKYKESTGVILPKLF